MTKSPSRWLGHDVCADAATTEQQNQSTTTTTRIMTFSPAGRAHATTCGAFLYRNKLPRRTFSSGTNMSEQRVALVTGAAGGIGRAMTSALLADGHAVAAVDRDAAALDQLAKLAGQLGAHDRLHPIVADLQSEHACEDAVATAGKRFGAVDAVFNNAGIGMSSIRPDA